MNAATLEPPTAPAASPTPVVSGAPIAAASPPRRRVDLTVLVPAYNEAASIADTVKSILYQTVEVASLIVIDDFSTDDTGEIARAAGATVVRPPQNTGSKAGAQNFALPLAKTEFVMAIDADTTLAPDAIEKLLAALDDPQIAAACGFVLPHHVQTIWERGRYIEYLFAFTFFKPVQDYYGKPLISSDCFSVYRTTILKANHGWNTRTMAEDMDLTWSFYQSGHGVRFVPDAVCYPIEPHDYSFMSKQLRRWSHGLIQNVKLHWKGLLSLPFLRSMVAVAMWDAAFSSILFLFIIPLLAIFVSPLFLLAYIFDLPAVAVPALIKAHERGETAKCLASLPSFLILRGVNAWFMVKALANETILNRPLTTYEKGH